jgi:hypothetical protein
MPKAKQKVPVSERALLQRINRKLAPDEQVRKARPFRDGARLVYSSATGKYFRVDLASGTGIHPHEDIEALGRKLGVLRAWEELEEES